MAGSSIMENLFQRTLDDLIKGLRLQLISESSFVSKALDEIRKEIKSTDLVTKSTALEKLAYLNSVHFVDMSFASFHVVELLSSPQFRHKKVAYLAASQSFSDATDVILLITNQLRKDLNSGNEFEVCLALECLSRIGNVDLCRDLTPEVFTLLSSSKSLLRKKAVGVILRVFGNYPDAVRVCFKRLVENLENSDPQTVSATVGVFCELVMKDPKSYLTLAPEFYRILVDSKNNWVLIKVMKIFGKLMLLEPRLAKRVVEPICEHIRRTGAKSLMFECIRTVLTSLFEYESAVKLAIAKTRELLVDDDPNLKYLGLQALSIIAPKYLWPVVENKEVVIKSLSDADPSIKLESLRLVMAMVSEDNVVEISRVLVNYALKSDPEFCDEILGAMMLTCSRNYYEIIVDFDWYVSLLGEITRIPHCQKGEEIEKQLIDIGMRVEDVRPQLVRVGRDLLIDPALLGYPFIHRILSAAAWVAGEYIEFAKNPIELVEALLQPRSNLLSMDIRAVYVQSAFKILIFCLDSYFEAAEGPFSFKQKEDCTTSSVIESFADVPIGNSEDATLKHGQTSSASVGMDFFTDEAISNLVNLVERAMGPLLGSHEVELLDRARCLLGFIELIKEGLLNDELKKEGNVEELEKKEYYDAVKVMREAFSEELGPVSVTAQDRVPVPDGLVLLENLGDLELICGDLQFPASSSFSLGSHHSKEGIDASLSNLQDKEAPEASTESTSLLAEHRRRHGLYYLPSDVKDIGSSDYPPANDAAHDANISNNLNGNNEDLVKLTEKSLIPKKKPNHAKPRPVVVKLEEGDPLNIAEKSMEPKQNILSSVVRDTLLNNEAVRTSSERNLSDKSSSRRKGKEKVYVDSLVESKENLGGMEKSELGNSSSRRSRHRSHGKDRGHGTAVKNITDMEGNVDKEKRSSHRHSRHKARQRANEPLNVVDQMPVIQDFLL